MSCSRNNAWARILVALVGVAYPFAVYAGLGRLPPGSFVVVALGLVAARIVAVRGAATARPFLPALVGVGLAVLGAALLDAALAAKVYPVIMSLGMSAAFGLSLRRPPTLVESLAAVTEPNPSPAARRYMRRVTVVWCAFLLGNAAVSAATLAVGNLDLWLLYNGLVSYLLMGTLFIGEYLVRRVVRRREAAP